MCVRRGEARGGEGKLHRSVSLEYTYQHTTPTCMCHIHIHDIKVKTGDSYIKTLATETKTLQLVEPSSDYYLMALHTLHSCTYMYVNKQVPPTPEVMYNITMLMESLVLPVQ